MTITLKDTFKKEYNDKIIIDWDVEQKKINKYDESAEIELPKIIKISKTENGPKVAWPVSIEATSDPANAVNIEARGCIDDKKDHLCKITSNACPLDPELIGNVEARCKVTIVEDGEIWQIIPNTDVDAFCLAISANTLLATDGPGTVTIGEPISGGSQKIKKDKEK